MGHYPIGFNEARLEAGKYPTQPEEAKHQGGALLCSREMELLATTGLTMNNELMKWGGFSPPVDNFQRSFCTAPPTAGLLGESLSCSPLHLLTC